MWDVKNRLVVVTNTVTGLVTKFVYDGGRKHLMNRIGFTVGTAFGGTALTGSHDVMTASAGVR